jgi:hypothetical protein
LFGKFAWADTVLLDPATLAVGTSIGEFLEVKEGCPDPSKTNCQATEKMKYITAVAGRTGKIEFDVNLTDNFELDVNVDWEEFNSSYFDQQVITLFKADNENVSPLYVRFARDIEFSDSARSDLGSSLGWQKGDAINNVELSAKNGTAYLNVNGTPFKDNNSNEGDTVALDTSQPFVKLVIAGIKDTDRLFEVTLKGGTGGATPVTGGDFDSGKQAGIQQCVSDPASCGITVTATCNDTTPTTGGAHANYNPANGEVHIPFIDVPGPFGDQQVYEVFLIQQPSTFSFDLDLNRLNLRQ